MGRGGCTAAIPPAITVRPATPSSPRPAPRGIATAARRRCVYIRRPTTRTRARSPREGEAGGGSGGGETGGGGGEGEADGSGGGGEAESGDGGGDSG